MAVGIGRRQFIATLGGAAATWPLAARAQQVGKIPRIGVLSSSRDNPLIVSSYPAFLAELGKLGFTGGEKMIEYRRIDEGAAKAFAAAAELARSNVDAMVTIGPEIALKAGSRSECD